MSYGGNFSKWMYSNSLQPYNSFGNGSAMRVSAVGWAFSDLEKVLEEAEASAAVTHDHPEGIRGAQAVALAVFLARSGASREDIRSQVTSRFGYDLSQTLDEIRPTYSFDETCQNTVPQALTAFLEGTDFEDAIRKAVSLGGDADTLAAITGSMAEPFFGGVPPGIAEQVIKRIPPDLLGILDRFKEHYRQAGHVPGMV
jgi:ADP-ribosylglycohydrolase